ncbi:MAG: hypothetical protein ACRD6X_21715 [Pyrinomonadaceae bacterium]
MAWDCNDLIRRGDNGSVEAAVFRGGRLLGTGWLTGGAINNGSYISVDLPDIYYWRDRDFGELGIHPELNIQNGGSYLVQVQDSWQTRRAQESDITTTPGLVDGKIIPRPLPLIPLHPVTDAYKKFLNSDAAKNCREALTKAKLWNKIVASAETVAVIDIDPISGELASKYFGVKPETAGKDVATYVGTGAKTNRGVKPGIYIRGGLWGFEPFSNPKNLFFFLHEHSHFVQPITRQPGQDLDSWLAGQLGIVKRSADSSISAAVSRYFNSGCMKEELGK